MNGEYGRILNGGCLMVEVTHGALIGPNRAELLRQIARGSSVKTAATSVGVTVKHATYLIAQMNGTSDQPLVRLVGTNSASLLLTGAGESALTEYDDKVNAWKLSQLLVLQNLDRKDTFCCER